MYRGELHISLQLNRLKNVLNFIQISYLKKKNVYFILRVCGAVSYVNTNMNKIY